MSNGETGPFLFCCLADRRPRATILALDGPPATPAVGTCYIVAVTCYAMMTGSLFGSMGLIVLPAEVLRMYPETQAATLGALLALTGLTQLVAPIAGYLSDRCKHRLGRRRPYMLAGNGLLICGLTGMYVSRTYLWRNAYTANLLIGLLGLNIAQAAHTGLMADMLPRHLMGKASGMRAVQSAVGAALAFSGLGFSGLPIEYAYPSYMVVSVVTTSLVLLVAHEKQMLISPSPVNLSELLGSFVVSEKVHGDFFWVFWIRCLYYMGVSLLSFIMLYFRDAILPFAGEHPVFAPEIGDLPTYYTAFVALAGQIGAICVAIPAGAMSDRHGRKPYIIIAVSLMIGVYMTLTIPPSLFGVLCAGLVFGMANGAFLAVDYALAVDTLPDKAKAAQTLGLWGIAAFVGAALGPAILGPTLHIVGLLSVGKSFGDMLKGGAFEHYGLPGYRAILITASCFVALAALLLRKIKSRGSDLH